MSPCQVNQGELKSKLKSRGLSKLNESRVGVVIPNIFLLFGSEKSLRINVPPRLEGGCIGNVSTNIKKTKFPRGKQKTKQETAETFFANKRL